MKRTKQPAKRTTHATITPLASSHGLRPGDLVMLAYKHPGWEPMPVRLVEIVDVAGGRTKMNAFKWTEGPGFAFTVLDCVLPDGRLVDAKEQGLNVNQRMLHRTFEAHCAGASHLLVMAKPRGRRHDGRKAVAIAFVRVHLYGAPPGLVPGMLVISTYMGAAKRNMKDQ